MVFAYLNIPENNKYITRHIMLDVADTAHILKNIQDYLRIKCPVAWVPDTRISTSTTTSQPRIETAKYQLQITIPDQHTFDMIRNRLFLLIEREVKHQTSPNEWQIHIPPEVSQWHHFGQKSGKYAIFYPAEFTQPGDYRICHAICERLLVQPAIMCRLVIQTVINAMGASNPEHTLHHSGVAPYHHTPSKHKSKTLKGGAVRSRTMCRKIFKAGCVKRCIEAGQKGWEIKKSRSYGGCDERIPDAATRTKNIQKFEELNAVKSK